KLEMIAPTRYKAKLMESEMEGDPATGQVEESLPPYNCFSIDGDVTAELVFVNYGIPADYEALERLGISVEGKIVIAKYYGSWRGIKPKLAAEKGAIGCLIYSDPADDGFARGDVYPEGAFKHQSGVQRGSVLDMPLYPGDPLTPGYGATADAERLDIKDAPTLTKIPVLPISYEDALPLLTALEGPVAPGNWRGALPITYHIGPGPAQVRLQLEFDWQLRPAHNVIAKMPGSTYPDEWVIRGNHHDAWVHGANDPISGMVTVLEEARALGELVKAGQRPKRTIVYCAWGAEEPGLLGSTEWVEHHAAELKQKAVAYINSDGNGRGFLSVGGSHSLESFFDQIPRSVDDPQKDMTIYDRWHAMQQVRGRGNPDHYKLSALGSGSDYSPFIQHLGIASLNLGFGGENSGGEYHTNFDTYPHYTRFKDPGFAYGIALTKIAGRTTLRLANADIIPLDFVEAVNTIATYQQEVIKLGDDLRQQTEEENQLITSGAYAAVADPQKLFVPRTPKEAVPYFNFAPLQNAMEAVYQAANTYAQAQNSGNPNAKQQAALNQKLIQMERALTREAGLPIRPWYRHHIYAPGFYTGYGVKTLPGVREAIEQRDWVLAQKQIEILAELLTHYAEEISAASEILMD
ncbi:MAG: transferrin receptor-like dimerization domain-containing protein, partial [Bacteroidia bacterium]